MIALEMTIKFRLQDHDKTMIDASQKRLEELQARIRELEKRSNENEKISRLKPRKHNQKDFFIADIFDAASFKDEIATMEHPMFALRAGDLTPREYCHNDVYIEVTPSVKYGLATIHDKDIWIYCISKLVQAINEGEEPSPTVRFTIYDYLVTTNRGTSGQYYENTKNALERLKGTNLKMEWDTPTHRVSKGIGLINEWVVVEEKDGRMVRVEVQLPDWLYKSALDQKNLLTISADYFRLRKPLDRRIYELARKHCGEQTNFTISLELLLKKSGASMPIRNFRIAIKSLSKSNELPDYSIVYDGKKDHVIFIKRKAKNGNR